MNKFERTLLANQYRILAELDKDNAGGHSINAEIFELGLAGLYDNALVSSGETSEEVCKETHDILTMCRVIDDSIDALTDDEKDNLDLSNINFEGFDGNNDDHYFFARFLIETLGRYSERKGKNLNSHSIASISKYRKMLLVYKELLSENLVVKYSPQSLQRYIDAV